jgi:hypothetical protein
MKSLRKVANDGSHRRQAVERNGYTRLNDPPSGDGGYVKSRQRCG